MSLPADAAGSRSLSGAGVLLEFVRTRTLALDVALVSGVSLVLGLARLGTPSLWYDEAYTYRQIGKGYVEQFDGYQPFYYWVQKPWTGVVGTSEWAMRFPSVVGAMLAGALLVVLGRKLFDRRIALVAALLLVTSPYLVKWSQQARVYPLILAASLATTLLLLRAFERGTRGAWAIYGFAYAGLLLTHALVAALLVAIHAVLIAQRRKQFFPHGLLAAVIVAAVGLPWLGQLAIRTNSPTSETAWIPFPSAAYATHALLDVSGASGVGLLLAAIGLWIVGRSGDRALGAWLAAWAFAPFVVALVVSLARPVFLDRYLVVAAPAFALLGGVALTSVGRYARPVLVAVVAVATLAGLAQWYSLGTGGNWRGEDWRSAVAYVRARTTADVVVIPWWAHDAADYYGARAVDTSTARSIWVLDWSETGHRLSAEERKLLGSGDHRLVDEEAFGRRVSAQRWERSP